MRKGISIAVVLAAHAGTALGAPVNDLIGDALSLPPFDGGITGTTVGATTDSGAPWTTTYVSSPGIWYTFQGAGGTVTFDTDGPGTDFDTKLHGYTDYDGSNLASLSILDDNDDTVGLRSEISFATTFGQDYWVLVSGFGGATGNFDLNFSSTAVVPVPAGALLLGTALIGFAGVRRRRKV
ncbi:putative secreted protein [Aliiruegeria haliotis]|uniref:Putative secreted protein n=1 Tax=Aliiruegeria haliotis TaxID=1280846 RepID=A0A2T0RZ85_9RHOB|nr:VPLPA-CTERM sorting domain-containing protein [Aliiruegeria haliotis]PRY26491.1 putative secreted protein [Aliiruegeria haliotis]